jgi:hypothetical protein
MIMEMLLNNDIKKKCSNDFTFSKRNDVHYWKKIKINFNNFIWTKSQ